MKALLQNLFRYRDIIFYRTLAGLKSESRQNYLGYIWFFLEPAIITGILYFVFGHLYGNRGPDVVMVILIGMIMWQWFDSSVMAAMMSIRQKLGILEHFQLPKFIFPAVNVAINTWKFFFVLVVVLLLAALLGATTGSVEKPTAVWLILPVYLVLQLLLILGLGMMLAVAVSYVNDMVTVVSSAMRLFFFLSGVFFRAESLPEHVRDIFLLNPMAALIECYRIVLLDNALPPLNLTLYLTVLSVLLFLAGLSVCRSQEGKLLKGIVRG